MQCFEKQKGGEESLHFQGQKRERELSSHDFAEKLDQLSERKENPSLSEMEKGRNSL